VVGAGSTEGKFSDFSTFEAISTNRFGALGLKSGSNKPGREVAGKITQAQLREIAEKKMKDLNANDLDAATKIIAGSARAMGLTVVEG